jgi:hypothetical protein
MSGPFAPAGSNPAAVSGDAAAVVFSFAMHAQL